MIDTVLLCHAFAEHGPVHTCRFLKKLQILNDWRGFYFVVLPVAEHDSACAIF